DMWRIEHDTVDSRVRSEDRVQQHTVAAPDIDDRLEGREVIGLGHSWCNLGREAGHGLIEDARRLGVLAEICENRLAVDAVECDAPSPDRLDHMFPGPPAPVGTAHFRECA